MKKVLFNVKNNTILTAILCCFAISSFSSSLYANVDVQSKGKKVILDLTHMYGDKATCKLIDQQGKVLYINKINALDQEVKSYDLSSLTKGDYTMIIEDEMSIDKIFLQLSDSKITHVEKSKPIYKPTFIAEANDKVHFNLLSRNKEATLSVTRNGEELYSETYEGEPSINEIIDFSQADKGDYTIKVSILGEVFYKNVSI